MIVWSAFTWEAFATLVTGLAAVGGAIWIGFRQTRITESQVKILNGQARTDQLRYRSELFERRWEVYDATARFLGELIAHADKPDQETQQRFIRSMNTSRFLFATDVHEKLRGIWREACEFFATKATMDGNYRRMGHYGEGMPERERIQLTSLHERLENLSEVFGDELRLSDAGQL